MNTGHAVARETEATQEPAVVDLRQETLTALHALLPAALDAVRRNLTCGAPDAEVAAARLVLEQGGLPATAYSFSGHISNQTDLTLTRSKKDTNGSWKTEPPDTIAPGASPEFSADYDGFDFTGKVIYEANGGEFELKWKIPLFGNNSIHASSTIPGTRARHEGGRGWHAEVWYYLEKV